jgi:hypothetical protein
MNLDSNSLAELHRNRAVLQATLANYDNIIASSQHDPSAWNNGTNGVSNHLVRSQSSMTHGSGNVMMVRLIAKSVPASH